MAKGQGVKIKIKETGECFPTIKDCAKRLNVNPSWLGKVSRGNQNLRTCRGYHILRIDEPPMYDYTQSEYRGRKGQRVKVVETGKTYSSIKECASDIDGSSGTISEIVNGKRERVTHKGYHFLIP